MNIYEKKILFLFFLGQITFLYAQNVDSSKVILPKDFFYNIYLNPLFCVNLEPAMEMGAGINYKAFAFNLSLGYGDDFLVGKIFPQKKGSKYLFHSVKAEARYNFNVFSKNIRLFISIDYFYWNRRKLQSSSYYEENGNRFYFDKGILNSYRNVLDFNLGTQFIEKNNFYCDFFLGCGAGWQNNQFSELENLSQEDLFTFFMRLLFWPLFVFDRFSMHFVGERRVPNVNLGVHIGYFF